MAKKKKVLFLCTHNSARSQMAEGWLNHLYGDRYDAFSAGMEPREVHIYAIEAMKEAGVDITSHRSKGVEEFADTLFDLVVTVCDNAKEACPYFPGPGRRLHQSFSDPAALPGPGHVQLTAFRRVRDEIREWVEREFRDND